MELQDDNGIFRDIEKARSESWNEEIPVIAYLKRLNEQKAIAERIQDEEWAKWVESPLFR